MLERIEPDPEVGVTSEHPLEPTEILPRHLVRGSGDRPTRATGRTTPPVLRSGPGSLIGSTAAVGSFVAGTVAAAAVSGSIRGIVGLARLLGARSGAVRSVPTESVLHVSSGLAVLTDSVRISWVHIEMRSTR